MDRFNSLLVSAYVTPGIGLFSSTLPMEMLETMIVGGAVFLLLHNGKNEDAVRGFFTEVHDIYVKYLMNPFTIPDSPIISPQFDSFVRNIAKRTLGT